MLSHALISALIGWASSSAILKETLDQVEDTALHAEGRMWVSMASGLLNDLIGDLAADPNKHRRLDSWHTTTLARQMEIMENAGALDDSRLDLPVPLRRQMAKDQNRALSPLTLTTHALLEAMSDAMLLASLLAAEVQVPVSSDTWPISARL